MSSILVSNPGSASRKYALFDDGRLLARYHFEEEDNHVVCTVANGQSEATYPVDLKSVDHAPHTLAPTLAQMGYAAPEAIGLRVVAPASYFMRHRRLDGEAIAKLTQLEQQSPLHLKSCLQELRLLKREWPHVPIFAISDSAFHATRPEITRRYAIAAGVAYKSDVYRFGYHGLSAESVVQQLQKANLLPEKLVIAHLGSGSSVIGLVNGKTVDTSMGFSPLEGLMMATRSGNIDVTAALAIKKELGLGDQELITYLNEQAGLLGVSGLSNDIRVLLRQDDEHAKLALAMLVTRIQQTIGGMAAILGGIDALVFSGTVGERSAIIRRRIINKFEFLGLELGADNDNVPNTGWPVTISSSRSHPIYVVFIEEDAVMASHVTRLLSP